MAVLAVMTPKSFGGHNAVGSGAFFRFIKAVFERVSREKVLDNVLTKTQKINSALEFD